MALRRFLPGRTFRKLRMHRLEDRLTPALTTTFDSVSGLLTVSSDAADAIVLGDIDDDGVMDLNGAPISAGPGIPLRNAEVSHVVVMGGPGANNIDLKAMHHCASGKHFTKAVLTARLNEPNVVDDFGCPVVIRGAGGDDTITGSRNSDEIDGGEGSDVLLGGLGNDILRCDWSDSYVDGEGGINGAILSLNGLPPGVPTIDVEVDLDNESVSFQFSGGPSKYNLLDCFPCRVEAGNFGAATGNATINLSATTAQSPTYLKYELKEVFVTSYSVSNGGGGGGGGSAGGERPTESVSFNFSKIEMKYNAKGSGGDDRFVVTPGRSEVSVDGGAGNDSVFLNHGGYPFTPTPTGVAVLTKAPVSFTSVETQQLGQIVSGDAALTALEAQGLKVSATFPKKIDKSSPILLVTVANTGSTTFSAGEVIIDGDSTLQLMRATASSGVSISVDPQDDSVAPELLAEGYYPYQPGVAMALPPMAPGTTVTGQVEYRKRPGRVKYGDITLKMAVGSTQYEFELAVADDDGLSSLASPVTLAATNQLTGQTSDDAPVTLLGADAGGATLTKSRSSQIDPFVVPSVPGLDHIYLDSVAVDVVSGTSILGNNTAGAGTVDAAGRFITFASLSTNLDPLALDLNGTGDIFLRDMMMGTTRAVSVSMGPVGLQTGNGQSRSPRISTDGQFIVFESKATDLVPGLVDTNNDFDVFLYHISSGSIQCLSLNALGTGTGNMGALSSAISGDGQTVAWLTQASDAQPPGPQGLRANYLTPSGVSGGVLLSTVATAAGLRMSGDGSTIVVWTDGDVGLSAGVPDGNGVSDILAIEPATNKIVPLSINGTKTAMGNGSSPAFVVGNDPPALCWDGSCIVFTSSADDLIAGAITPTTGGVFLVTSPTTVFSSFTTDRCDQLSGGGFGGNNSQVTISPDGTRLAFVSSTNYQSSSPATYPDDQVWAYIKLTNVPGELRLASGKATPGSPLYDGGPGVSSNPLYTPSGLVLQTNAPIGDLDGDGLPDVVSSFLDRTLTWITPNGNGADAIYISKSGGKIVLEDKVTGFVVNSHATPGIERVYVRGSDNEPDAVVVELDSGMSSLLDITVDGGTGLGNTVTAVTDRKTLMNWYHDSYQGGPEGGTQITAGRYHEWMWGKKVSSSAQASVSISPPSSGGGAFDVAIKIEIGAAGFVLTRDPGTPAARTVKIESFTIKQSVAVDSSSASVSATIDLPSGSLPAGSSVVFIGSQGNDVVDASMSSYAVSIDGGAGNDTVTGGSAGDELIGGSGTNLIRGGFGNSPDNICIVAGANDQILDADVFDTTIFATYSRGGISFDSGSTAPQLISPSGDRVQLSAPVGGCVGTDFTDAIACRTYVIPHVLEKSGRLAAPSGDTLTFDAQGLPVTDLGGRLVTPGYADVEYSEFEHVVVVNPAPPQVVMTVVNDGAVQRSMVGKLVVSFNFAPMFVGNPADAFTVEAKVGGALQLIDVALSTVNGFTHATITPVGVNSFNDGRYILRIDAADIVGGLTGGNYASNFHRLFGDADGNASITAADFNAFRLVYGTIGSSFFDFDGDNAVTASDFNQFRIRYGVTLAP